MRTALLAALVAVIRAFQAKGQAQQNTDAHAVLSARVTQIESSKGNASLRDLAEKVGIAPSPLSGSDRTV